MLLGDFDVEDSKPCLSQFLFEMNVKNFAGEPTCYKNLSYPSCNGLAITHSSSGFPNTKTILTGLSDFHI